ncbi:hypothetical protein ACB092_05G144500 [Castanea dentata]
MSVVSDMSKLKPFEGHHYKRWSKHMLFYLEAICVNYVLFDDCIPVDMVELASFASTLIYEKDNRIWCGHILHYFSNSLFNIYCSYKYAKEIWEALKKKYSTEDAGTKKYVVGRFLDYKMNDDKPIWNKSMKDLIVHIRVEESNREKEKSDLASEFSSKANLFEQKQLGKSKNIQKYANGKGPNKKFEKNDKKFKRYDGVQKKKRGPCFVCEKVGHNTAQCVGYWGHWAYLYRNMFAKYEEVNDGENVFLGDARTTKVVGKGKVILKLTSGKSLALNDVLHAPDMHRNLVSGFLLNIAGLKLVFESHKLVLSHNGDFVGKGFCHGGLFVLDANYENMK